MSIVLDVMVLVIVAVTSFIGYKRGFVRYIVRMLGTIACVVVALVVSDIAAGPVYTDIVAPRMENALVGKFDGFDITSEVRSALNKMGANIQLDDKQLKKALTDQGSLPAAFERAVLSSGGTQKQADDLRKKTESFFDKDLGQTLAEAAGLNDPQAVGERLNLSAGKAYDLVRSFATDNKQGIHYLVYNILDTIMTTVIRYVLFAIIFIVLEIIVAIVFRLAGVLDHLPAISGANKSLGLAAGMLKGVLYVLLIAAICAAIVKSDEIMDPKVFEDSHIFKLFFGFFYN